MADEKKEEKVTLEDLQKQIKDVTGELTSLKEENAKLKEDNVQKELEIAKLSLGGVERKVVTKEEKEDEEVSFDFDF